MNLIQSFYADITCGDSCWHAREAICHCSCGGKNHGSLRTANGEQPVRTAKIDGHRYELAAVGLRRELYDKSLALVNARGFSSIRPYSSPTDLCHYTWKDTESRAPARLKYATQAQLEKWPELAAYRQLDRWERAEVSLLWREVEQRPINYCKTPCKKCAEHQQRFGNINSEVKQ